MPRLSASYIKSNGKGNKPQDKPKEGSRLRAIYDVAITGEWFSFHDFFPETKKINKSTSNYKILLEEYDLEFVSRRDPAFIGPNTTKTRYQFRCVGIWVGSELKTTEEVRVALENSVSRDPKGLQVK